MTTYIDPTTVNTLIVTVGAVAVAKIGHLIAKVKWTKPVVAEVEKVTGLNEADIVKIVEPVVDAKFKQLFPTLFPATSPTEAPAAS